MVRARFCDQRPFEELAHLAATLADQRQNDGVEGRGLGDHGKDRRLADAGAGEDADALALAQRGEEVDDAHAGLQRLAHARPGHGGRRRPVNGDRSIAARQAAAIVDRLAECVDDAALPVRGRAEMHGADQPGDHAGADGKVAHERLDGGVGLADAHDLADGRAGAVVKSYAIAELGDGGEFP